MFYSLHPWKITNYPDKEFSVSTPWRCIGEHMFNPIRSLPRHQMDVSDQHQIPTVLHPVKKSDTQWIGVWLGHTVDPDFFGDKKNFLLLLTRKLCKLAIQVTLFYCSVFFLRVLFHKIGRSVPQYNRCILSNTTRQILMRTHYIGDIFRLIL
jgi:hypothetical protein